MDEQSQPVNRVGCKLREMFNEENNVLFSLDKTPVSPRNLSKRLQAFERQNRREIGIELLNIRDLGDGYECD